MNAIAIYYFNVPKAKTRDYRRVGSTTDQLRLDVGHFRGGECDGGAAVADFQTLSTKPSVGNLFK